MFHGKVSKPDLGQTNHSIVFQSLKKSLFSDKHYATGKKTDPCVTKAESYSLFNSGTPCSAKSHIFHQVNLIVRSLLTISVQKLPRGHLVFI